MAVSEQWVAFLLVVLQEASLLPCCSFSVFNAQLPQLPCLSVSHQKRRKEHGGSHTEGFYASGLEISIITFAHVSVVELSHISPRLGNMP